MVLCSLLWGLFNKGTAVSHHTGHRDCGVTDVGRVAAVLFVTLKLPYKKSTMKLLDIRRSLTFLLVALDNPPILGRCKCCKMDNRFSLHQLKAAGDLETVGKLHVCDFIGSFLLKYIDGT